MKLKALIFLGVISLSFFSWPAVFSAQADYNDPGLNTTITNAGNGGQAMKNMAPIDTRAASIIGTFLSFVGIAFLILMIYAGILWMVSQGNEKQLEKSRGILINAIIGLIIVILAYAVTSYVGQLLTAPTTSGGNQTVTTK